MNTLIDTLRDILGAPDFWVQLPTNNSYGNSYQWDYGAMIEYAVAGILICVVVSSVFKFLRCLLK